MCAFATRGLVGQTVVGVEREDLGLIVMPHAHRRTTAVAMVFARGAVTVYAGLELWGVRVSTAPLGGMARIVRLSAIGIRSARRMVSVCQTEAANAMQGSAAISVISVW
jgi:hypothetical protein